MCGNYFSHHFDDLAEVIDGDGLNIMQSSEM